jgi:hypothetical protein
MTTLVIDREALPKSLSSIFSAPKLRFEVDAWGGSVAPVIDPDDYDNDTDYLNAIPGMAEKLIEGMNTPLSECERVPRECFNV